MLITRFSIEIFGRKVMEENIHNNSTNIFIVEDEKIVALDIAASLKSLGYNVTGMASSGNEAIDKIKKKIPDLILMDIRLKGDMDGITTAETIRSEHDIPIIYLTAYADENTLERAKHTEPYGYLLKPYEKRVLHSTIEMAHYKRKMEWRIKESERWLNALLIHIGDAVIATDNNGRIKFINPVAELLTGWSEKIALSKNLSEILKLTDEFNKTPLDININEIDKIVSMQGILTDQQENERTILLTISPIKDENKSITGIVVVFQDITEQRIAEKEREDLFREASTARERLKVLSKRLIEVQELERRKLARELHDEVGQILTAIKINLQTAKKVAELKTTPHLDESVELVDDVLTRVRNLSLDLRPSMLDDLGLVPALRWYVDKQSRRTGLQVNISAEVAGKRFSPEIEITCYRILQEAVNNVIKHAEANKLNVELWNTEGELHLRIVDNGAGFNVYSAMRRALNGESTGILGMQERVELVGGKLRLNSKKGAGTDIHAIFPVDFLN
jgi:PAS domain S-box-containing protein